MNFLTYIPPKRGYIRLPVTAEAIYGGAFGRVPINSHDMSTPAFGKDLASRGKPLKAILTLKRYFFLDSRRLFVLQQMRFTC